MYKSCPSRLKKLSLLLSMQESVLVLDCRPVFSFSSCHISGAVNINLASVMRKRFLAGKIGLLDLIPSSHNKDLLQVILHTFLYVLGSERFPSNILYVYITSIFL